MSLKDDAYGLFVNTMEGSRDRTAAVYAVVDMVQAETVTTMANAIKKFAPDLAAELVGRWNEQSSVLADLLKVLR